MNIKKVFFDDWGLTGIGMISVFIALIVLVALLGNSYTGWQCKNYELITGFETKYVDFDVCYIKDSSGVFVRYDNKFKSVN
jgi:hypothetical protein